MHEILVGSAQGNKLYEANDTKAAAEFEIQRFVAQAIDGRLTFQRLNEILERLSSNESKNSWRFLYTNEEAQRIRQEFMTKLPKLCALQNLLENLYQSDEGRTQIAEARTQLLEATIKGAGVFLTSEESAFLNKYSLAIASIRPFSLPYAEKYIAEACSQRRPF